MHPWSVFEKQECATAAISIRNASPRKSNSFFFAKKRKQIWEVHDESRDFFNHCNFEVCAMQQMKKHRRALLVSSLSYLYDDAAVNARKTHTKQSGGLGKKLDITIKIYHVKCNFACSFFLSRIHLLRTSKSVWINFCYCWRDCCCCCCCRCRYCALAAHHIYIYKWWFLRELIICCNYHHCTEIE